MPPEMMCPFCGAIVPDWHFEWHGQQDQMDIFSGRKTMECPLCHAGVRFDGFEVSKVEPQPATAKRDVWKAARWARNQNKSLREYLQTKEGKPYVTFWTEIQIEAADKQARADLE